MRETALVLLTALCAVSLVNSKCAYRVLDNGKPLKIDEDPRPIKGLTQCLEYNGKMGCCDVNNDNSQVDSYKELDGVFSTKGGGCDICAINLKRFWCEYACSPRQSDFMITAKDFVPVPDPKDPDGPPVMVQKVKITVHADTACALYNSCKRVGFVSSVSAMSTPAGFLNFLGHNGVDDAFQYIDVDFSYDTKNSLYFNDDHKDTEPERAAFDICNKTTSEKSIHGFPVLIILLSLSKSAAATIARTAAATREASSIPSLRSSRASTGSWCSLSGAAPSP